MGSRGAQAGDRLTAGWMRILQALALTLMATTAAAAEPPRGAVSCSGCHAASPKLDIPVPPIRGRDPAAIAAAMQDFRSGARPSTVMGRVAKGFSDDEIRAIAAWLAVQQ